jgi:hypothetical protein
MDINMQIGDVVKDLHHDLGRKWRTHGARLQELWRGLMQYVDFVTALFALRLRWRVPSSHHDVADGPASEPHIAWLTVLVNKCIKRITGA